MRALCAKYVDSLVRFASFLVTLIIGVAFVMVTSVNAAPPDKKFEVKDKVKIEMIDEDEIDEIEEIEELEELEEAEEAEVGEE